MNSPKRNLVTAAIGVLLLIASFAMHGAAVPMPPERYGGDSVAVALVDGVPLTIDESGSVVDLALRDVEQLDSDVRAVVETDDGDAYLLLGGATSIEPTMAAVVAAMPIATTVPSSRSSVADTHPKQPAVTFALEKKWTDEKGLARVRKATLEVEKRSGETTDEHIERAERELEKWEKKGWTTV